MRLAVVLHLLWQPNQMHEAAKVSMHDQMWGDHALTVLVMVFIFGVGVYVT